MTVTDQSALNELVLHHGKRVRRLWFIGAFLCLLAGGVAGGIATYQYYRTGNNNGESVSSFDRDDLYERLGGAAAVGLGFPAMLIAMGFFAGTVNRRLVGKSTVVEAQVSQVAGNALLAGVVGNPLLLVLGKIAPVRTVGFSITHEGQEVRQVGHLFGNEIPYGIEKSECLALKIMLFGKPAAMLVCREGKCIRQDTFEEEQPDEQG